MIANVFQRKSPKLVKASFGVVGSFVRDVWFNPTVELIIDVSKRDVTLSPTTETRKPAASPVKMSQC